MSVSDKPAKEALVILMEQALAMHKSVEAMKAAATDLDHYVKDMTHVDFNRRARILCALREMYEAFGQADTDCEMLLTKVGRVESVVTEIAQCEPLMARPKLHSRLLVDNVYFVGKGHLAPETASKSKRARTAEKEESKPVSAKVAAWNAAIAQEAAELGIVIDDEETASEGEEDLAGI